jgi:hypothetical protein
LQEDTALIVPNPVWIKCERHYQQRTPETKLYCHQRMPPVSHQSIGCWYSFHRTKKRAAKAEDAAIALQSMTTLNKLGEVFGKLAYVKAMTDVTGFGLLGHLSEMCEGSNLSAEIEFNKVPVIPSLPYYLEQKCYPRRHYQQLEQLWPKNQYTDRRTKIHSCRSADKRRFIGCGRRKTRHRF